MFAHYYMRFNMLRQSQAGATCC